MKEWRTKTTLDVTIKKKQREPFELVKFLSKYGPFLKKYLHRIKMSDKITVSFLLPRIQYVFITILGENVK